VSKALKEAIEANDAEAAKKALKTVKDLSKKLPKAEPPLVYACQRGADAVIDVLLDAGALQQCKGGPEALHPLSVAVANGNASAAAKMASRDVPKNILDFALWSAVTKGKVAVVEAILQTAKPAIPPRALECSTWRRDPAIFNTLLAHGADVNVRHDGESNYDMRGRTPLHMAAQEVYFDPIKLLLDHGADVNARDAYGTTPLMLFAVGLPRRDLNQRSLKELQARRAAEGKPVPVRVISETDMDQREMGREMDTAALLLERGADASARDRFGNDALDYYFWHRTQDREPENAEFVALLKKHGTAGNPAMDALWIALHADDVPAAKVALANGADPNRQAPPSAGVTPLIMSKSPAMLELLLQHGADPNKASLSNTPLIANCGNLEMVKRLVEAGANIHAIRPGPPNSEYVANAWSSADMNRHHDVAAYLNSLGATNPVRPDWQPMALGVVVWEDFSEVIANAPPNQVAAALARMIGGTAQSNIYGKEMPTGKKSFAVLQPREMAWSNVMQITPPLGRFQRPDEAFLRALASEAKCSAVLLEYNDASDATRMTRFEPGGQSTEQESSEEVAKLKNEKRPALDVEKLAQQERFVVAWGSLIADGRRAVEVSFSNLPAEAFDETAWVHA
jgi:ankyrin repeat protein